MARHPRVHVPGAFYHVTLRGNHRQAIFRRGIDLLVKVSDVPLGRPMQRIGARYARWFQSTLPTTGHLFERRYHALLVDVDSYLLEVVRYIHLNPVRAELVDDAAAYAWSSHGVYLGDREEPWVTTDFILGMLSPVPARARIAYRNFVREGQRDLDISAVLAGQDTRAAGPGARDFLARLARTEPRAQSDETLDQLIARHCRTSGVRHEDLAAATRDRELSRVRAMIAHEAVSRGIASMAAVARRFYRDESSIRECVKRYIPLAS